MTGISVHRSLQQGTLSAERPTGIEEKRVFEPKGLGIDVEDFVGKVHCMYLEKLPENISDVENVRLQNKLYELVKDELAQPLNKLYTEMNKAGKGK